MNDWISVEKDEEHIRREKSKVRDFKKTSFWKNKIAKGRCHYCQKSFKPEELTLDHIVPLARGGFTKKGNVVPSCKSCNFQKKYKTSADLILENIKNG